MNFAKKNIKLYDSYSNPPKNQNKTSSTPTIGKSPTPKNTFLAPALLLH